MKILHLPLWAPNKNDIQLGNFIQEHISLSAINNEVHSLVFFTDENIENIKIESSADVTRIYYPKSRNRIINFFRFLKAAKIGVEGLKKKGFEPELVHCHVAGRNLWLAQKYYSNKPIVLSEHWSGYLNGNFESQSYLVKKYLIRKINRCDIVTSVSAHLAEGMRFQGVKNRILLLQNVIRCREKLDLNKSEGINFLIVADLLDEVKNISGAITAMHHLHSKYPEIKLYIIGDGPDSDALKNTVKALGLEAKISFLGRLVQTEVQNHLLNADCTIVNSNYETYSMVTIESILTGVPVIATRCGGPEQFVNTQNGFLIPKSDSVSLEKAMEEMIQNRMDFNPKAVRESLSEDYSVDKVEKDLTEIYLGLTE